MSVRIEKNGPVWTIIHSRPEVRNAIDPESAKAIYNAFNEFNQDKTAYVAVLWGEGGAFCSGWDLKYASAISGSEALESYDFPGVGDPPMAVIGTSRLELSKPVIAAVSGAAVAGGMEVAIWCDIRVMEETAFMGIYNRRWGIPLIDGGTVRLPRLIGEGRAMDLILTGRRVEADEALKIGLCEYVVPPGDARSKAESLAHDLAKFPQSSMRADRKSVRSQHGLPIRDAMKQEWSGSKEEIIKGVEGALKFVSGKGRGGDFRDV
jgi:enoyl-CoA hydratase